MPSLGPAEILVILVVALLVFGPNKMPEIARQVGRGMREFRRVQQHLSTELRDVVSEFDGSSDAAPVHDAPPPSDPVPTLPPKFDDRADADASIEPHRASCARGDRRPPTSPIRRPTPKPSLADNVCGHLRRPPPTPDPLRADPTPPGNRRPDDGGRAPVRAATPARDLHHRGRDRRHDHVHPVDGGDQLPRHVLQGRDRDGRRATLIFTGPLDAFATRLKIATYGGIVLAPPVWLYELWRFITPGLNPKEKRYAVPFVLSSIVLFIVGGDRRAASPSSPR